MQSGEQWRTTNLLIWHNMTILFLVVTKWLNGVRHLFQMQSYNPSPISRYYESYKPVVQGMWARILGSNSQHVHLFNLLRSGCYQDGWWSWWRRRCGSAGCGWRARSCWSQPCHYSWTKNCLKLKIVKLANSALRSYRRLASSLPYRTIGRT